MSKKTLLIQPIQGKFVQSTINGKTIRVWLVDPDTNSQGTEILYNDAIAMLALPHPVVCPAQIKGKDGKFIQILDEDDEKAITEKKDKYLNGESSVSSEKNTSAVIPTELTDLLKSQSETIKAQNEQMAAMQQMMSTMQQQFNEMMYSEKSSKKTEKKEKKEISE